MYLDDLMRHVEDEYDHAYLGAMDGSTIELITSAWLDTAGSDVAWARYKDGFPAPEIVSDEFQDELQEWFLAEWEKYLEEQE